MVIGRARAIPLAIMFAPFLVNLLMTLVNAFTIPPGMWRERYDEAMAGLLTRLYSVQSIGMMATQVAFGALALRQLRNPRELYTVSDIRSPKSWGAVAGLVALSFALFFLEGIANAYLYYGGSWESYREMWAEIISATPVWARYMNALVAPFTAGVFEEAIWRGYGITKLEEHTSPGRAVVIQALAFGLWHINPLHVIVTFAIGLAYGSVFIKRRKLLALTVAHVATDFIGFSSWLI